MRLPRMLCMFMAAAGLVGSVAWQVSVRGTTDFYASGFEQQWQADEAIIPGVWGPLQTATARNEPYAGYLAGVLCPAHPPTASGIAFGCTAQAFSDQRTVEYFDKGRMEWKISATQRDANGRSVVELTNGLLTVELKSGQVQTGDTRFEQRTPAALPIAGDPGNDGPTYADLAALPERDPDTGTSLLPYTFDPHTRHWDHAPAIPIGIPQQTLRYVRREDPNGAYRQNVLTAFEDIIARLPNGVATVGLPISPVFFMRVPFNGAPMTVIAQAFERRILLYNPTNAAGQQVEFGNIGRDYYTWRYGASDPARYGPTPVILPTLPPAASRPTPTATAHSG
jgi:hypothetical protein